MYLKTSQKPSTTTSKYTLPQLPVGTEFQSVIARAIKLRWYLHACFDYCCSLASYDNAFCSRFSKRSSRAREAGAAEYQA